MRKYMLEILGFAVAGIVVWIMLGGDIPGIWTAAPPSSSHVAAIDRSMSRSEIPAITSWDRAELSAASHGGAPRVSTAQASAPGLSLAALVSTLLTLLAAIAVAAFGVVWGVVWWLGRQRLMQSATQLTTPGGVIVELPQPAPRPQPIRAQSVARIPQPAAQLLPMPAPRASDPPPSSARAAGEAWTILSAQAVLDMQQRLGWTLADDALVPNREKRILELQAKFGAMTARVAPNYSLAIFPNVLLPLDELQRKAAPQPAVLSIDGQGQPIAVVGLCYADQQVAPGREQAAQVAPAPSQVDRALAVRAESYGPATRDGWSQIARPARISPELPLAVDAFLSEVFVIAGRRRTGKSYTLGVVLEELCQYRFPFAVVDLEGETYGLRERFPVLIVGRSSATEVDVAVTPEQARSLAQWVHSQGQQMILDLSDYSRAEQISFVAAFAEGLWEAAKTAVPRRRFAFVLDEAHELYPQKQSTEASDILDRLVLRGGKWGVTVGLATQRPANLHINGRTQAGIALLHLVEQARDLAAYADILPKEWTDLRISEAMHGLGRGKVLAKITYPHAPTEVRTVQIRQRRTPHMGYSPGMDEQAPPKPGRLAIDTQVIAQLQQALNGQDAARLQADHAASRHEGCAASAETSAAAPPSRAPEQPYVPTDVEGRMLTLAITEFDQRWPLKQLWPRIRDLGWVSWDSLNKELTPRLAAVGLLAKDEQGRWYVTERGCAAVQAPASDAPCTSDLPDVSVCETLEAAQQPDQYAIEQQCAGEISRLP